MELYDKHFRFMEVNPGYRKHKWCHDYPRKIVSFNDAQLDQKADKRLAETIEANQSFEAKSTIPGQIEH